MVVNVLLKHLALRGKSFALSWTKLFCLFTRTHVLRSTTVLVKVNFIKKCYLLAMQNFKSLNIFITTGALIIILLLSLLLFSTRSSNGIDTHKSIYSCWCVDQWQIIQTSVWWFIYFWIDSDLPLSWVGGIYLNCNTSPKQMVWVLYIDLICLDYDGNVTDACVLALTAALLNSEFSVCLWLAFDEVVLEERVLPDAGRGRGRWERGGDRRETLIKKQLVFIAQKWSWQLLKLQNDLCKIYWHS